MKKLLSIVLLGALAFTGCLTKRTSTVTGTAATGFTTNTVTTVNEDNLAIDSAVFQSVVTTATALLVQHDPASAAPLRTAQRALDDVVNGVSQQSVNDVLGKLKAQGNPVVAQQVDSLLKAASAIEQKLVMKYGSSVAGEITIALVRAADAGLVVGLQGH